ncbi:MAG: N-acetylmuramoyl-L-alanine amidase [Bacteroidales bacterium]|nr:N-acetylmuramoyl-L-alanine amidase [Bacteroidales bacterium]
MASTYLWILDNGHGKATAGKRSPKLDDGRQLLEYEYNRKIVAKLIEKLNVASIDNHNLVPETEGDISLEERVKRANDLTSAKPKMYVSIHGNAYGSGSSWTSPNGIETYYYTSSLKGRRMARIFQEHLIEEVGWNDRGIKTANFYVLKYTDMPAVLSENGFYTNKDECIKMLDDTWIEKIATAHFKAIKEIEDNGGI